MIKKLFGTLISSGTHPGLEDSKKLAIQIANFDAFLTFLTIFFYSIESISGNLYPLNLVHGSGLVMVTIGFFLIRHRHYDAGRILIQLNGIFQIYLSVDAYHQHSGLELYYFTALLIPFVTFSLKEHKKGILLSGIAGVVFAIQYKLGTGLFISAAAPTPDIRAEATTIVVCYLLAVLGVVRWQLDKVQQEISQQQSELIHSSSLIALGEMSGGIAHEINNPLQVLTFQSGLLRKQLESESSAKVHERLLLIDQTIMKMAKMVKGLRDLSRDDRNDPGEQFPISEVFEDVMNLSSERLKNLGIEVRTKGELNTRIYGHPVQIAQVLVNLFNNSVDAIKHLGEKWIELGVTQTDSKVLLTVTDAGSGIPHDIQEKIMNPFFTTKDPSVGTGLGLSISRSIIEKNGGKFYYDSSSPNTRFIIELPV